MFTKLRSPKRSGQSKNFELKTAKISILALLWPNRLGDLFLHNLEASNKFRSLWFSPERFQDIHATPRKHFRGFPTLLEFYLRKNRSPRRSGQSKHFEPKIARIRILALLWPNRLGDLFLHLEASNKFRRLWFSPERFQDIHATPRKHFWGFPTLLEVYLRKNRSPKRFGQSKAKIEFFAVLSSKSLLWPNRLGDLFFLR